VSHVFREANYYLDVLATIACGRGISLTYYEHCRAQWSEVFFEEAKLVHLNWHQRESNLKP
jgi:hypothetical protein